ncbi:hypothetical protein LAUMK13_05667 [Mycobacterium innocens]|uniref:Uncharacterized protein n=1 Tax=Mycobacterium innocens TaxID=2341083 RepID=A0A498QJ51_9MYCO|nr:hypothetical protein LAUMK13_05667 [Mycobacterium innocens]
MQQYFDIVRTLFAAVRDSRGSRAMGKETPD